MLSAICWCRRHYRRHRHRRRLRRCRWYLHRRGCRRHRRRCRRRRRWQWRYHPCCGHLFLTALLQEIHDVKMSRSLDDVLTAQNI